MYHDIFLLLLILTYINIINKKKEKKIFQLSTSFECNHQQVQNVHRLFKRLIFSFYQLKLLLFLSFMCNIQCVIYALNDVIVWIVEICIEQYMHRTAYTELINENCISFRNLWCWVRSDVVAMLISSFSNLNFPSKNVQKYVFNFYYSTWDTIIKLKLVNNKVFECRL